MISLFEQGVAAGLSEERTVLPLEFESLDVVEENVAPVAGAESDVLWREQIAALEAKFAAAAEASLQQVEAARREAALETRAEMAAEMEQRITVERTEVASVVGRFGQERARYFAEVEREVVSLALAIAARVLHREAMLDPMLLRAAVRVALDKVAGESSVRLRVPEEQAAAWGEVITAERGAEAVVVTGDSQLAAGDVVLETVVGRVELGVGAQLKEIERGFFDLLEKRPK